MIGSPEPQSFGIEPPYDRPWPCSTISEQGLFCVRATLIVCFYLALEGIYI